MDHWTAPPPSPTGFRYSFRQFPTKIYTQSICSPLSKQTIWVRRILQLFIRWEANLSEYWSYRLHISMLQYIHKHNLFTHTVGVTQWICWCVVRRSVLYSASRLRWFLQLDRTHQQRRCLIMFLKMFVQLVFSIGWAIFANLHFHSSKKYSYMYSMT
jgi:hypothetical protein